MNEPHSSDGADRCVDRSVSWRVRFDCPLPVYITVAGFRSSTFTPAAAAGVSATSRAGPALTAERLPFAMGMAGNGGGDHAQHQPNQEARSSSRAQFVGRVSAGVAAATAATGLAAGGLGVGAAPVFADR